jgi:hypothetical protein
MGGSSTAILSWLCFSLAAEHVMTDNIPSMVKAVF